MDKNKPGRKREPGPWKRKKPVSRRQGHPPPSKDGEKPAVAADDAIRLNRYIAQAGICSRRKADALIREGRVVVNGTVVTDLGTRVNPKDRVEVGGKRISPAGLLYLLLHKPGDTITTTRDERGRKAVLDLIDLPDEEKNGLYPVGRLDRHTTGVLLLTNDGELAHRLMHPRYRIDKLYQVETAEPVKPHELAQLREGVALDDGPAQADRVAYLDPQNHRLLGMQLHEGRNRQIRRMFEALGHTVTRLERVSYAGLTTQGVRPGKWRRLEEHEVRRLYRMVKL